MIRNRAQILAMEHGNLLVDALEELEARILSDTAYVGSTRITHGNGSPEGIVPGRRGDLFLRLDGSTSTTLYVKTNDDVVNKGWTAK